MMDKMLDELVKKIPAWFRERITIARLHLVVWALLSWLFAGQPIEEPTNLVLFAVTASTLGIAFLHLTDYYEQVRVLPHRSHVFLATFVIPLAGLATYAAFVLFGRGIPFSIWSVALASPAIGYLVFRTHASIEWRAARNGHRKKIVLDVLPQEVEGLVRQFHSAGYQGCVDFLGPLDLKKAILQRQEDSIAQIIMSRGGVRHFHDDAYLIRAHLAGIPIVDRRKVTAELSGRIRLSENDSWSFILSATKQTPLLRTYADAKLYIEPVIAVVLAVLLSPILIAVALAIRWASPGPILYRQTRTGYLGKNFALVKFRSMRCDSEVSGPQWAKAGDDRVTPIGKFIRRTRLDELPQLWNVIRGEMSFFGPRPERPEFYPVLKEKIPLFSIRTNIRPGITGWAQVCAGYAASIEESATKLEFDLYYIRHVSLRLDLIILYRTLMVAFLGSERARTMPAVDAPAEKAVEAQPNTLKS